MGSSVPISFVYFHSLCYLTIQKVKQLNINGGNVIERLLSNFEILEIRNSLEVELSIIGVCFGMVTKSLYYSPFYGFQRLYTTFLAV